MQRFLTISYFFLLFGCTDTDKQRPNASHFDTSRKQLTKSDTLPKTKMLTYEEIEARRKQFEEQEKLDSLRLLKVLTKALEYAEQNKTRKSFQHEFEMLPDDSSFNVTAQLHLGNLFQNSRKHLLIRRKVPWGAVLDIYLLQDNKLNSVIQRIQSGMTYIDDTLRDVNGDKYKDFLVHWYPSAGCCLRDVFNVYLYQPQTGTFTKDYEFINPTFSPEEKIIRGLEYGHPGEAGLYKYKWNGLHVDTIEFVYPYTKGAGKFIRTKKSEYKPTEKDGTVLKSLPSEYKKIDTTSIGWFLYN